MTPAQKKKLTTFTKELNDVSPSFCVAKWKQVTLHLQTGKTHSCHHPTPHKIPIDEIKIDVSALHNTSYKKEQRKKMLIGERPEECSHCWKVEDNTSAYSDRITKSIDKWASPFIPHIANSSYSDNINPSYLEVSFSNTCNFKCSYCSPEISSKWFEEIKQHGPYPTSTKFNNIEWLEQTDSIPILEKNNNPYIDAFWKWWPSLYPTLQVMRITGGEPLLTKHTFKVLDYIKQVPSSQLELNVNSNLCVPEKQYNLFLNKITEIVELGSVKEFKLYTSCESTSSRAEYIRHGLNYDQWLANCYKFLDTVPNGKLTIMSTYNALNVSSFALFLKDVVSLKEYKKNAVSLDISLLRWPAHLSIDILTDDFISIVASHKLFIKNNPLFEIHEINRMERIFINNTNSTINRQDFLLFVDEHDRRRGTDFKKTFPEMEKFLNLCNVDVNTI
jgi:hypothetical protein